MLPPALPHASDASSRCTAASSGGDVRLPRQPRRSRRWSAGMRRCRPTVFISVPKKWIQLHEEIARAADLDGAPTKRETRRDASRDTGGRLRFGLSGRGPARRRDLPLLPGPRRRADERLRDDRGHRRHHDDPAGRYKDDSLGPALPGIELARRRRRRAGRARAVRDDRPRRAPPKASARSTPTAGSRPAISWSWTRTATSGSSTARRRSTRTSRERRSRPRGSSRSSATSRRWAACSSSGITASTTPRLIWPNPRCTSLDFSTMTDDERTRALPVDRLVGQRVPRALRADRRFRAPRSRLSRRTRAS